ncbi:hypothetical protein FDP41_002266 [Naegleria fowleri]|uniref:General transcription factor IIH subunit n=1 Tax=Naegleria fowleri TaxID=5763 RepID=A0A6A5BTC1_NAEFO|nr:uncharacterized protein FDP41_002266 [Naegleria fowleri]KAF0978446.1 hypothetical protein FDP41_002266 [Naegleria fowleri]CAG4716803.1 unnamed protein product [Naegleria fowleri]
MIQPHEVPSSSTQHHDAADAMVDEDHDNENELTTYNAHKNDANTYRWEQRYDTAGVDALEEQPIGDFMNRIMLEKELSKRERVVKRHQLMYWNAGASAGKSLPQEKTIIKKGIIRFLYLVIDCSNGIMLPSNHDEKTSRAQSVISTAKEFIKEYFDQNPLSQLGLITTKNGVAKILKELTGNVKLLIAELKKLFDDANRHTSSHPTRSFGGDPSLQNVLTLSYDSLHQIPNYGSKEVVIIYCSLSTCDPDNIFDTIKLLRDKNIRVSVISLDAELYICKQIAKQTQGTYNVPMDDESFKEMLMAHAAPPPTTTTYAQKIVAPPSMRMGFPQRRAHTLYSMCLCHKKITPGGYICPRCKSKYCDLPVECATCGLMLVSSPHLARSYHHLFPVQQFVDYAKKEGEQLFCYGCQKQLSTEAHIAVQCPSCTHIFCVECDAFIHESLHNCPGCN